MQNPSINSKGIFLRTSPGLGAKRGGAQRAGRRHSLTSMHDLHALRVTHAPPTTPRAKHDPSSRRPRPPVPLEALLSQRWVTLSTERSRTTAGLGLSAGPRSGRPWGASAACAWRLVRRGPGWGWAIALHEGIFQPPQAC